MKNLTHDNAGIIIIKQNSIYNTVCMKNNWSGNYTKNKNSTKSCSQNNQITKIVWTENAKLYYVKKGIFETIFSKRNLELVWFQFVSKYGEFGKHQDNKLNPSYKDVRRLFKYKDISKKEGSILR